MGDLTGLPALDVLIGMAFLFFLLATVVSSVNELIQTALNARARTLNRGIKTLLTDEHVDDFFGKWRVAMLARPPGFVRRWASRLPFVADQRRPSYVPARTFALTLIETPEIGADLFAEAQKVVEKLGVSAVQPSASTAITDAQRKLDATRAELERVFDEVMDRASGWYKRYVQWWLVVLSLGVVFGLNVNAFTVAERLWKDDALRTAVVQQAQQQQQTKTPQDVATDIDDVTQLKLPIGWDDANKEIGFWSWIAGCLVAAAAVALGAPFWFDVLGKLSQLRGTGNREGTAKTDRAPEDRDDPSGRR